jgi:hypothetical protein
MTSNIIAESVHQASIHRLELKRWRAYLPIFDPAAVPLRNFSTRRATSLLYACGAVVWSCCYRAPCNIGADGRSGT